MGAPVIVLVLPVAQLRGELGDGPEARPAVECLLVGAMTSLDLAIGPPGTPAGCLGGRYPQVAEMPCAVRVKLPWSV